MRERLRWIGLARLRVHGWSQVQELTHGLHRFGAIAAGEQTIVTDAMETLGEDVGEEAANELADLERHGGVASGSLDPIVLDRECDAATSNCRTGHRCGRLRRRRVFPGSFWTSCAVGTAGRAGSRMTLRSPLSRGQACMGLLVSTDLTWTRLCVRRAAYGSLNHRLSILLVGGAGGYVGEGEHFPAFRACSGSGGSGAGRRRRSSTYPPAVSCRLCRGVTKASG